MRVTQWIHIDSQEVEVEIGFEDIRAALSEHLARVEQAESGRADVLSMLNSIAQCLKALTDAQIADLLPVQRSVIAKFLDEQVQRFGGAA